MLRIDVARALPEILYFRCPVCAKRFPGSAFANDVLTAECEACGSEVDSPHVAPMAMAFNDRAVESPFTLAEIAQHTSPRDELETQAEDITEQLREAFDALSQVDRDRFLEETLPRAEVPELTGRVVSAKVRLIGMAGLLGLGAILLILLYLEG